MTINQMAGTFILHYWVTAVAIVMGYISRYYRRKKKHRQQEMEQQEQSSNRRGLDHSESSNNPYSILYRRSQWLSRRWSSSTLRSTRQAPTQSSPSLHVDDATTMATFAAGAGVVSSSDQENSTDQQRRLYKRDASSLLGHGDRIVEGDKDEEEQDDMDSTSEQEMWKRTQEELLDTKTELRETKKELQETRREIRDQMETILKLLKEGKQ
jgi:hypothetical protein